jgi:hypothetical protein
VGPWGVRVTVAVTVRVVVAVGLWVMVGGGGIVGVLVGLDAAVGELMADAVGVKKSFANASRVWIFSTLNVAVGELTTFGKSFGWVSGICPPVTRIGIP